MIRVSIKSRLGGVIAMHQWRSRDHGAAVAAITALVSPGARAQSDVPEDADNLQSIEVTGTAERIIDPLTALEYYEKFDRKIKAIIDPHIDEKIPYAIQEFIEIKFDFPDLVTQNVHGNTFLN